MPDVNRSLAEFAADFSDGEGDVGAKGEEPGGHHLRPGRGPQRRRGPGGPHRGRARGDGPFVDFYDFCQRVDPQVLNKRTLESLIKAGGFDSLGHPRRGLCLVFEEIVDRTLERRREHDAGVVSLFATLEPETDGQTTGFADTRIPIPDTEFDKSPATGLRKGDARALHQRPPPHGPGGLAGPADRLHPGRAAGHRPRVRAGAAGGPAATAARGRSGWSGGWSPS